MKEIENKVEEALIDLNQSMGVKKILIAARKVKQINEEEAVTGFKKREHNERRDRWEYITLHGQ